MRLQLVARLAPFHKSRNKEVEKRFGGQSVNPLRKVQRHSGDLSAERERERERERNEKGEGFGRETVLIDSARIFG